MRKMMLAAAVAALCTGAAANADVTFNVNGAFSSPAGVPDGTLTGTFTTNNALTAITSYALNASSFSTTFVGFAYNNTNSSVTASVLPSQYFQIDTPGSALELRLYFATPLTSSGTTLNGTFSYESEPVGGNRSITGTIARAVSATPEPGTWAMMIVGFGLAGYALRRRQKVATRVSFA